MDHLVKSVATKNGSKNTRIFLFWFLPLKNYTCLHFALFVCHVYSTSSLRIFLLGLPRDDIQYTVSRTPNRGKRKQSKNKMNYRYKNESSNHQRGREYVSTLTDRQQTQFLAWLWWLNLKFRVSCIMLDKFEPVLFQVQRLHILLEIFYSSSSTRL